jgi:two-component system cell cycle sensor histidine kinase/response regulator CckA
MMPAVYRALIQVLDQAVCLLDPRGTVCSANPPFYSWLGCTEREILGNRLDTVWPVESSAAMMRNLARSSSGEQVLWLDSLNPGGQPKPIRCLFIPIPDEEGRLKWVLGFFVARDLSEQDQTTESAGKETFLPFVRGIAHDLNNLFVVLRGGLSMLLTSPPAKQTEMVHLLENTVHQASVLARQLHAFPERRPPHWEIVNLSDVVHRAAGLVRGLAGPLVQVEMRTEKEALLEGNSGQLLQVVVNLALNACEAMPSGGCVTLEVEKTAGSDVYSTGGENDPYEIGICLRVKDTGTGIAPEVMARLFEPSFSTKARKDHHGLGLAIVREIVEAHGGRMGCASSSEHGTCFEVLFPSYQDPTTSPSRSEPEARQQPKTLVLVGDPDPSILQLVRLILEQHGCQVEVARSGRELINRYRTSPRKVDLILLDQHLNDPPLPTTLEQLQAINPGVRLLLMGSGIDLELRDERKIQLPHFLGKPYRSDQLVAAVQFALSFEDRGPWTVDRERV